VESKATPRVALAGKDWNAQARRQVATGAAPESPQPARSRAESGSTAPTRVEPEPEHSLVASQAPIQLLKALYRAIRTSLGVQQSQLDPYGEDPLLVRELMPAADFLYDRYWRITVEGSDKLPAGPCMLVANHSGALPLDGAMLRLAVARQRPDLPRARWLLEERILRLPLFGVLLNRIGAVHATPENALRLLSEGTPLIVFPEGTQGARKSYRQRHQLKPFGRGGFVKIAARASAPIVPVAIVGAGEAMPLLASIPLESLGVPYLPITLPPLPTRWRIRFGEAVEITLDDLKSAEEPVRSTERIRTSVQAMIEGLLSSRRSVFVG
jgi:1-acyl-sn-glycerol-3-phosphate acyltransferase